MTGKFFLRYINRFYFPVFVALALLVYTAQLVGIPLPAPINNHLNDLLCMPIVLKICQATSRYLKKDKTLHIPIALVFTLTLGYALYFEWFLPKYNPRYTADSIDVLLYFLGALFFIGIERYGAGSSISLRQ